MQVNRRQFLMAVAAPALAVARKSSAPLIDR